MRISGTEGREAWVVNGVFDPVEGVSEGMPVYRKRDNADRWLEFDAPRRVWVVTDTEVKGTGAGCAFLRSDPPRLPDHTLGSVWQVLDGDGLVDQPSVSVTLVSPFVLLMLLMLLLLWLLFMATFYRNINEYDGVGYSHWTSTMLIPSSPISIRARVWRSRRRRERLRRWRCARQCNARDPVTP